MAGELRFPRALNDEMRVDVLEEIALRLSYGLRQPCVTGDVGPYMCFRGSRGRPLGLTDSGVLAIR